MDLQHKGFYSINIVFGSCYVCVCLTLWGSLGVEPVDRDVMLRPPRGVHDPIITRALVSKVLTSAAIIVIGTLWVFWKEVSSHKLCVNFD